MDTKVAIPMTFGPSRTVQTPHSVHSGGDYTGFSTVLAERCHFSRNGTAANCYIMG